MTFIVLKRARIITLSLLLSFILLLLAVYKISISEEKLRSKSPSSSSLLQSNFIESNSNKHLNVAFAKTHKTGSSTLQNILLRFGVRNGLNFAFPEKSWIFKLDFPLNSSHVLDGPWKELGEFNIFAAHSRWNYDEAQKMIPEAKFITLLRDPSACFESNYVYMGLQEHVFRKDINQFAVENAALDNPRRPKAHIGKNQLLWDLGMAVDEWDDEAKVRAFIAKADAEFDLVLITEKFDESLILMQELLGWDDDDVAYVSQNQRRSGFVNAMKPMTKAILSQWLWADYLLYEHFKDKLEKAIDKFGRVKMAEKVHLLRQKNDGLKAECIDYNVDTTTSNSNNSNSTESKAKSDKKNKNNKRKKSTILDKIETFKVRENSGQECQNVLKRETDFVREIRLDQSARAKKLKAGSSP